MFISPHLYLVLYGEKDLHCPKKSSMFIHICRYAFNMKDCLWQLFSFVKANFHKKLIRLYLLFIRVLTVTTSLFSYERSKLSFQSSIHLTQQNTIRWQKRYCTVLKMNWIEPASTSSAGRERMELEKKKSHGSYFKKTTETVSCRHMYFQREPRLNPVSLLFVQLLFCSLQSHDFSQRLFSCHFVDTWGMFTRYNGNKKEHSPLFS